MVLQIKTIACLLAFQIWFNTIKPLHTSVKRFINNTLVIKKIILDHSLFWLQNLSTTPQLLHLCFYPTYSREYGENINRLRNHVKLNVLHRQVTLGSHNIHINPNEQIILEHKKPLKKTTPFGNFFSNSILWTLLPKNYSNGLQKI